MTSTQKNGEPSTPPAPPTPKKAKAGSSVGGNKKSVVPAPLKTAQPAGMRSRHWGVMFSFIFAVVLPVVTSGVYLWFVAEDRYSSVAGFTVRKEEGQSSSDLLTGLAQFTGGGASTDSDVLYEFIRSQNIVRRIDEKLDLRSHYEAYWSSDPIFAIWPNSSIEDLLWYWSRIVRVSFDRSTGLIQFQVTAYDSQMAQDIAQAVVIESQNMVNALNEVERSDAIRYADIELQKTQKRLREAREALTKFRVRTQIVDLELDIQGQMGVVNNLQQQLALELVSFDELAGVAKENDPRLEQAVRRIQVIRERIANERLNFATTKVLGTGEDYPTLIAEFEGLTVERAFAEQAYLAALAARDAAQENAERQSRYLATYVSPTLAESSEYPQRFLLFGLAALFLILSWSILVLIYYSIRDRN